MGSLDRAADRFSTSWQKATEPNQLAKSVADVLAWGSLSKASSNQIAAAVDTIIGEYVDGIAEAIVQYRLDTIVSQQKFVEFEKEAAFMRRVGPDAYFGDPFVRKEQT
jgi:hypothetical protein